MKVLVLGGTRFVGLRLVRMLASKGYDITILNRGKTQAKLPEGIKRLYADRRDPDAVRIALKGQDFDVIFDITGYQVRNLEPVVELFAGRIGHYIFQSTCGVYTLSEYLPVREDFPRLSPITTLTGLSAYEVEKVQCEDYLLQAHKEKGFPVSIIRCPPIYGPENWMDEREASFFVRLLQGRKILIPGDGSAFLHFAYVDDVARAHISIVGNKNTLGQAYNIADACAVTINGYIDAIAEAVGVGAKKIYIDASIAKSLKWWLFFPFFWLRAVIFDISKAKEDFGFYPQFDIKSGMKNTYEWWVKEKGIEGTKFIPGRLGYNVDFAYEDEIIKQYG